MLRTDPVEVWRARARSQAEVNRFHQGVVRVVSKRTRGRTQASSLQPRRGRRDGSVGIRDGRGASRALTVDRLGVRTRGLRGAGIWEPLIARVRRTEQLPLFAAPALDEERRH